MLLAAFGILRVLNSGIVLKGEWAGMSSTRGCCEAAIISCLFRLRGSPALHPKLWEGICPEVEWEEKLLHQIAQKGLCGHDTILLLKSLC